MSEPAYDFGVVCEARADRDTASGIADRVLVDDIDWLDDALLDTQRRWRGLTPSESFLRWASVRAEATNAGLKNLFGHFGKKPAEPDALVARRALLLFAGSETKPQAVMLVRDSDADDRRRIGLEQARADRPWPFQVIIGVAEPKRECWVLTGFDARESEEDTLKQVEQRLSFHPVRDAHKLTAREHGAKNDAKKALEELASGSLERERECLQVTPLETLRQRGERVGLTQFLSEISERLVPVMDGSRRGGK
ncbi:hypothetical protein EJ065_0502 [Corallococcus coralloides]|uniref:Uncharacterized protein n=1 Tax=Corallococcus coralloides TaxID=184914 RepID=A0A410RJR8_CORCK|nr:hypothetical protein [Corallococcus coralloides]QAT82109.1 hypothetical protein EJ065_0502 [Corallococcus coralloides]